MVTIDLRKLAKYRQLASILSEATRIWIDAVTEEVLPKQPLSINMLVRSKKKTHAIVLEVMLAMLATNVVLSAGRERVVSKTYARLRVHVSQKSTHMK